MTTPSAPYQIVIFTHHHSLTGGIFLHEQRISDFMNDRRDTNIVLRSASVARLENPAHVLQKTLFSVIPKEGIVIAFEPPQKVNPTRRGYMKFPKQKYEVYMILDGMEVRGFIHVQGSLDLLHVQTDTAHSFLPVTDATVSIETNPGFLLKREAIIINTRRIRFIGEVGPKTDAPAPIPPFNPGA